MICFAMGGVFPLGYLGSKHRLCEEYLLATKYDILNIISQIRFV